MVGVSLTLTRLLTRSEHPLLSGLEGEEHPKPNPNHPNPNPHANG